MERGRPARNVPSQISEALAVAHDVLTTCQLRRGSSPTVKEGSGCVHSMLGATWVLAEALLDSRATAPEHLALSRLH